MTFAASLFKYLPLRRKTAAAARTPAAMPAPLMLALEPRIVYDASAAAIGAAASAPHHHADAQAHRAVDASPAGGARAHNPLAPRAALGYMPEHAAAGQTQVVFVDPNVTDYQALITGLPAGTRYVVLNGSGDGLAQIAQYLKTHPGVESIYLISHGSEGQVQAGSSVLDLGDISAYGSELAQIGAAMKPGGNFLIYGCDVAQGSDGHALVQDIAALTGLNVAASTHPVGAASLGGSWTLDYDVGSVNAPAVLSASAEAGYGHLLAQTTEDFNDLTSGSADSALYNDSIFMNDTPVFTSTLDLDGITYTTNVASFVDIDVDPSLQALPSEINDNPQDMALLINQGGPLVGPQNFPDVTSIKIAMTDGRAFSMSTFDIDLIADAGTITIVGSNGSTPTSQVTLTSDGSDYITESVTPAMGFTNVTSVTITGSNLQAELSHLVYSEASPTALTTTGGTTAYELGGGAVTVNSGLTLSDPGASTQKTATVTISGGKVGGDTLSFTNTSTSQFGDIIESGYNATTGVLTLTSAGVSTNAQWQAALNAIAFSSTSGASGNRTISFATNDGAASNTVSDTVAVTAGPVVTTTGGVTDYASGGAAVQIDSGISVTDGSKATQTSATVSIGNEFQSGDTLDFVNQNGITGSYDSATGTLTLTGSSSTADWTSALESIQFSSTSHGYGNRTISFDVSDGTATSAVASKTVDVVNPVQVTTDSGSASFVAGDNVTSTPVAVDSGLAVSDSATGTLGSATISITTGLHNGEDMLLFVNNGTSMGDISGAYNASTGVLTLTSASNSATLAQWNSALDSVTYTDTAVTPNPAARTISFTVTDSGGRTSNTATRTVTVADTDQTPIVSTIRGTTSYVGGTHAVTIDSGITVSDRDNATQVSATVSISSGFQSGDALNFVSMSGITGAYDASTGVLVLTASGSATDAQWASALSSVAFSSTSTSYGNRTISFSTNDGTKTSAAATDTVDVLGPPQITTDSGSAAFVAGDNTTSTPVVIDSGLQLTDGVSTNFASAAVSIAGNFKAGEDVLSFTNDGSSMGNISGAYDPSTGALILTSAGASATTAQWQSALEAVTYTDTAVTPNPATRTISFAATDAGGNTSSAATRTVTVADIDQTPIVSTRSDTTNYVGGASAVTIDSGITVSDLDNATQMSATVSIGSGFHSGDTLAFTNTNTATYGNIVASYDASTGVLTLTSTGATASDGQWANALSAVSFSASSASPGGNRTIAFTTNDGTKTSAAATDTVDVLGPPQITTDSGSAAFVAGDNTASTPVVIDSGLTLTDGASSTLASATISITGNLHSGEDVLTFTNDGSSMGNIAGAYDASTGVLTLTSIGASATLAQWQNALDAIAYTDRAVTPNNATRTISFAATDAGGNTSNMATRTVTVADNDQTPIVSTAGATTVYRSGSSAATIDSGITVSDLDNATQASATVSIGSGFQSGDILAFTNDGASMGNIVASYNASTGVMTLTSSSATATTAQWASALSSVTFSSTSTTYGNRTIAFSTNDGTKTGAAATDTVDVVNPMVLGPATGSASFAEGDNTAATPVAVGPDLTLADAGAAAPPVSATIAITDNFHSGEDVLAFANTNTATFGDLAGTYNAATGVLTLTSASGHATVAQWQNALDAVTYKDTSVPPATATRTISFTVADGSGDTSNTATRTVTVTATDQSPVVTAPAGTATYAIGRPAATIDAGISVSDLDNTTQTSATVSIGTGFQSGDALAFANTGSAAFGNIAASYNASTGVLTLTSAGATATNAQWASALSSVTFSSTSAVEGSRTISFAVNDGTKTSAPASVFVQMNTPPAPNSSNGAPGAVPVAAPPEIVPPASPDAPFNPAGGAESNTPSVLVEMDDPHPVGATPSIPTMTFTGTGTPSSYMPGRTSVPPPPPLVPPELSAPGDSPAVEAPAFAPPVAIPVDAMGGAGAFTIDISSVDSGAFADATDMSVSLADGKALPAWLHYDASKGTLSGALPAGAHDVHVLVQVRDASGHVIRREIVLAPNDHGAAGTSHMASPHASLEPAPEPSHGLVREAPQRARLLAGKPSLAHQFAAARAALHVARPAPELAAALAAAAHHETASHA